MLDGQALLPLSPCAVPVEPPYKPLTASGRFTLHAAAACLGPPRPVSSLRVWGARGHRQLSPLAGADGTYRYDLKRPLHDGRTCLVWTGEQLVRKLVPLIPPPSPT